jgi:hypothetical protein
MKVFELQVSANSLILDQDCLTAHVHTLRGWTSDDPVALRAIHGWKIEPYIPFAG